MKIILLVLASFNLLAIAIAIVKRKSSLALMLSIIEILIVGGLILI
ncbi:MAG: hypothetical protein ABIG37_02035 [Nanoarchaeota archaeon]|nr:hypothetical protein [Nanoarchaeota archaeon]